MIEIRHVADLKGAIQYCSCNSCGKSSSDEKDMIQLSFKQEHGTGIIISLCSECRKELHEKISGE